MSKRIDKESSKTRRMFELFFWLHDTKRLINIDDLEAGKWGNPRTVRRILNELNEIWKQSRGKPLFEIVDGDGSHATQGERFLKTADKDFDISKVEKLAAFPAFLGFLRILNGTILADQIQPFYKNLQKQLTKSQRAQLERTERKFVFVGKGVKSYSSETSTEILDQVYDALLKEVMLKVTTEKDGVSKERILQPLAMVMFNGGLYLLAKEEGKESDDPRRFRLEGFNSAEALRDKPFRYPINFKASDWFDNSFGLMSVGNDARFDVELQFINDPYVKRYVKERQYTKHDEIIDNADSTVTLRFKVNDLTELKSWVLSWGPKVKVIKPEALRREVADAVTDMLNLYSA